MKSGTASGPVLRNSTGCSRKASAHWGRLRRWPEGHVANTEARRTDKRGVFALVWLAVVIVALFAGGTLLWAADTRSGLNEPEYSIRRTDDRGIALLYRLYERRGLKPQVWNRDLTDLREPGLLILIAPAHRGKFEQPQGDVLPDEVKALDDWIRKGGVVAVLARDPNPIYEGIGLIVDEP